MYLDGAGYFRMDLDDRVVGADAGNFVFDGDLALVNVDLMRFLEYVSDILAGDGAEETAAIADFHGNRDFNLGESCAAMS